MKQALFIASFADLTRPQVTSPAHSTGDTAVTDRVSPAPEQGCPAHPPPALSGPLTASVTTALSLPLSAPASPRQMRAGPGIPAEIQARPGHCGPAWAGGRPETYHFRPRHKNAALSKAPGHAKSPSRLRSSRTCDPDRDAPRSSLLPTCERKREEAGPKLHMRRGSP
ncbi:hypothetical protein J1605_014215 [Eschrichtius robustus]|uniref:Uncharacterized protein n=1 Tax=Eschrichtius robustus TaxID=9764 RepID=A0AB34GG15_ESCRO|nr:hypothetical protein J1605_014215 [Eschrichtius robustus]